MKNASRPLSYERRLVAQLACRCPWSAGNPKACPLHRIRTMTHGERRAWVSRLSNAFLDDVLVYHWACLEEKVLRFGRVDLLP
jgi:hypothetical protein